MKNDYNKRTMALLVSDVGCIVWGTTAALAVDFVKVSSACVVSHAVTHFNTVK